LRRQPVPFETQRRIDRRIHLAMTVHSISTPVVKLPAGVVRDRVRWSYLITLAAVHLGALLAFAPWFFSWTGVVVALVGVQFFGMGINVGYHRLLAHGSFRCKKWVERALVHLAICCLEDTPIKWVCTHRRHHQHSDKEDDPHSPKVSVFWSHVGWLFLQNPNTHSLDAYSKYARDLVEDPFYRGLERRFRWLWIYVAHAALFMIVGAVVGAFLGGAAGALQMSMSLLVWGVFVRTVAVWHITWSVNSLSHVWGYRSYQTRDDSTNNWFVALVSVGEGWHNNHHHAPTSASNHHRWWEVDVSYMEIRLLQALGLAWDVKVYRPQIETVRPAKAA
jgi:fatty-acid desaturase